MLKPLFSYIPWYIPIYLYLRNFFRVCVCCEKMIALEYFDSIDGYSYGSILDKNTGFRSVWTYINGKKVLKRVSIVKCTHTAILYSTILCSVDLSVLTVSANFKMRYWTCVCVCVLYGWCYLYLCNFKCINVCKRCRRIWYVHCVLFFLFFTFIP